MAKKARTTQSMANAYPFWSDVRNDEQSMGYQFFNTIGKQIDDIQKQQQHLESNRYLSSAIVSDIDVFYSTRLPNSFEFELHDADELNPSYTTPIVSGETNGINYPIAVASGNDIETWWYDRVPDRVELGLVASGEHYLASGLVFTSPFAPLTTSGETHTANKLWVTVSGGTSYIDVSDDGVVQRGLIQVEGTTREGASVTEELVFIHDDTQPTIYDYSYLTEIRAFDIEDDAVTNVMVESARFNHHFYQDQYVLDNEITGEEVPIFWSIEPGETSDQWTLAVNRYNAAAVDNRLAGYVSISSILKQELQDTSGTRISPRDIALEPNADRVWLVDDTKLYCYSTALPYPSTKSLISKDYDAASVIVPNKYYFIPGEAVILDYIWRRPSEGITRHRVWVEDPTGTKYSVEDGAFVTYVTGSTSWISGEPTSRTIRNRDTITLALVGSYTFFLEVQYADDTSSVDAKIVTTFVTKPLCEFTLTGTHIEEAIGVDFDSEHKLWVMDNQRAKYEIVRYYDAMIIDFDRKVLYFKEDYDKVRVLTGS
jgi:hypothetical protein